MEINNLEKNVDSNQIIEKLQIYKKNKLELNKVNENYELLNEIKELLNKCNEANSKETFDFIIENDYLDEEIFEIFSDISENQLHIVLECFTKKNKINIINELIKNLLEKRKKDKNLNLLYGKFLFLNNKIKKFNKFLKKNKYYDKEEMRKFLKNINSEELISLVDEKDEKPSKKVMKFFKAMVKNSTKKTKKYFKKIKKNFEKDPATKELKKFFKNSSKLLSNQFDNKNKHFKDKINKPDNKFIVFEFFKNAPNAIAESSNIKLKNFVNNLNKNENTPIYLTATNENENEFNSFQDQTHKLLENKKRLYNINPDEFEEMLLNKHLTNAEKEKQMLLNRLKEIEKNISNIKEFLTPPTKKNTILDKSKKFDDNEEAKKNALQLVRKMNKLRSERKFKKSKQHLEYMKKLENLNDVNDFDFTESEKIKEEKKNQYLQKLEIIKKRKEEREQHNKNSNKIIKQKLDYLNKNEFYELEKKKQELVEKRKHFFKPADEQKNIIKQKENEYKDFYNEKHMRSIFTNKIIQEDKEKKLIEQKQEFEKKKNRERRMQYGKLVYDMFGNKGAPNENIVKIKKNEIKPSHKNNKSNEESMIKYIDNAEKNYETSKLMQTPTRKKMKYHSTHKKKKEEEAINSTYEEKKKAYENYIEALRKKRIEDEKKGIHYYKDDEVWQKVLKNDNLSNGQKFHKVLNKVNVLENEVQKKEIVSQYDKKKNEDIGYQIEIDKMYLNTIKAKLALLDTIQKK